MLTTSIRWRSSECVLATCGPVLVMLWVGSGSGGGSGAAIKAAHRISLEMGRAYPDGIAHFNVVVSNQMRAGVPEDTRQGILAMLRDLNVPLRSAAVVLPGDGFVSALVRSLLAGVVLLARSKTSFKFVPSLREAERFLRLPGPVADRLGGSDGALAQAVERLRADVDQAAVLTGT